MDKIYKEIKIRNEKNIRIAENKIFEIIKLQKTPLESYFEEFLFNGAKRLRPLFIFLISKLLDFEINEDVYNLAAGVELMHSASLIHDDILDDAEKRRGKPCIHKVKDNKTAVLAGDYLLSCSMNLISEIKSPAVFKIMADISYKMSESEITSLLKRGKKISKEDYLQSIKNKTSSLFTGAISALYKIQNKIEDEKVLKFTENFSLIFQLRDDINNFLNLDENKISSDLNCGISTLPYIIGAENNDGYDIMFEVKKFMDLYIKNSINFLNLYENEAKEDLVLLLNLFKRI